MDCRPKCEIQNLKLLEKNRENVGDFRSGDVFLDMIPNQDL